MNIRNSAVMAALSCSLFIGMAAGTAFAASDNSEPAVAKTKPTDQGATPTNPVEPTKGDKNGTETGTGPGK